MVSAYSPGHLLTDTVELLKLFFQEHLILDVKQHSDYKSLVAKTFDGSTLKIKAASPI